MCRLFYFITKCGKKLTLYFCDASLYCVWTIFILGSHSILFIIFISVNRVPLGQRFCNSSADRYTAFIKVAASFMPSEKCFAVLCSDHPDTEQLIQHCVTALHLQPCVTNTRLRVVCQNRARAWLLVCICIHLLSNIAQFLITVVPLGAKKDRA